MRQQPATTADGLDSHRRVLTTAVLKAAEIMGLRQAQLAKAIGVSESTITRMKSGGHLLRTEGKEWELAALVVRLFRSLDAIMAGDERALHSWLAGYNTALKEKPLSLICSAAGLARTVDYVDAYRARV